jgi:hypothetical protein
MRKLAVITWLLIPLVAGAYHYGPGQNQLVLDEVDILVSEADTDVANGDHAAAATRYDEAVQLLPDEQQQTIRRLRLERDKAWMLSKKLPEAHSDLAQLLEEISKDESVDPALARDVRATLANSQYYLTWLMRLEGRPEEDWQPTIEASRQSFRMLAESAGTDSPEEQQQHTEDLESAIRLARMDLKDLQGLPLPSQ